MRWPGRSPPARCSPGSIAAPGKCRDRGGPRECVPIAAMDSRRWWPSPKRTAIDFCRDRRRSPLVGGLWDAFEAAGIRATGPSKAGATLEGSKGFVKDLCAAYGIPTAAYRRFTAAAPAKMFADTLGLPVVIKADGLAAGKGVIVAEDPRRRAQGRRFHVRRRLRRQRPRGRGSRSSWRARRRASSRSATARPSIPLAGAQDHKAAFDGDVGPKHRRHGRLFAGAGAVARHGSGGDGALHQADRGRDAGQRALPMSA